ncbi:sensor histidine kinase [Algoriphagus mannitolivorans]|uniref:sensor histidine kinase n=1 Tax=Algoriphagus mannitolivorans TaxID=226504 RepID=UPI00042A8B0C|nr:histidine kinase [Algoriphagus mannitolivorans]
MIQFLLGLIQENNLSDSLEESAQASVDVSQALVLGLIPVVLAFAFIIFVIYRSRREADVRRKETELRLSKAEGELKALRAQINPHFIFNCLNSIHHFIQTQEPKLASEYLIKFSKLIRYVLESSSKNWVTLEEELEANSIYLQLEQLRLNQAFQFEFKCQNIANPDRIFIPPMLIQPFLENAVWHGLSQEGRIQMEFQPNGGTHLICKISDEGQARIEKPEYDLSKLVKKSSLGVQLMEERFKNLTELRGLKAGFELEESESGGRVVTLKIPMEEE